MSKIKVLTDKVANQIAAGEVIERPAAVIKELMENSLDAGATRIEVEFRNGGKSYMRVEDNGCGMTAEEAMMSLERHGTSKMREMSDLESIRTFGFRGEAIPSIASVSKFVMRTRAESSQLGCEILINGGKWVHKQECGMSVGTMIEVSNLFNSVPVRRKFMKTENTEAAHIIHLVRLYALGNPNVGFRLLENGHQTFKSLSGSTLMDRVGSVWSKKVLDDLIEINVSEGGMSLYGLIGKPGVGRSTRGEMITFVNNRPVDSKTLNYALIESYHTYITKGRFPVCFLFFEIEPVRVDVNVHPAKKEVRFRDEGLVRQFIIRSVLERLKEASRVEIRPLEKVEKELIVIPSPIVISAPKIQPKIEAMIDKLEIKSKIIPQPVMKIPEPLSVPKMEVKIEPIATQFEDIAKDSRHVVRCDWHLVGRIKGGYCIFETAEGMVLLNVRAAQQRIYYEKIQKSFEEAGVVSQPLLFPISFELGARQGDALKTAIPVLKRGGFGIEEFGRNFFRIEALPDWLDPAEAEKFVTDVAFVVQEEGLSVSALNNKLNERLARLAVHSIKTKDRMNDEMDENLVTSLFQTRNPMTCPSGKKIYLETTYGELKRRFGN